MTQEGTFGCRMYEQKYPEVEDLVMVHVRQVTEMGAYVSLLEYNNIEGMILLSELSRRRIRSINKLIRVGRNEVVVVLRVDKEKGYIDLSKRRASPEEVAKCEEKFNKSKAVHSIMHHVSEKVNIGLEDLYMRFGWALYKKYGHAFDALKAAIAEPDQIFAEFELSQEILECLFSNIKRRLTPQAVKIRADFEATCFEYEGIDAIKSALRAGQDCGDEESPVKIKLVAPPLYVMLTQALDKDIGVAILTKALEVVEKELKKHKGILNVKVAPRCVSERDDKQLKTLMEEMDKENREVEGDSDDEEDQGMGNVDIE